MDIDIETKINRWQKKADLFLKENIKCFIKTIGNDFHSADILFVGESNLLIYDFIKKEKFKIYWFDVLMFEEWVENK